MMPSTSLWLEILIGSTNLPSRTSVKFSWRTPFWANVFMSWSRTAWISRLRERISECSAESRGDARSESSPSGVSTASSTRRGAIGSGS